jgi:hypothetical protein
MRHNIHAKFHEYRSSQSLVIKYVQTDITSEVGLVEVRLS